MCFSANASFGAAAVLGVLGVVAMKKARTPSMRMLAATPFIFAIQQLSEGILWTTLPTNPTGWLSVLATYWFLFFAYIFWPIWIPLTLSRLETQKTRLRILYGILAAGSIFATYSLIHMLIYGATAHIVQHHIAYASQIPPFNIFLMSGAYLLSVVVSPLISSVKNIWIFGVIVGAAYGISNVWYPANETSVWCFFAALISGIIILIIYQKPEPSR
jgi:hypothetical protein